MDEVSIATPWDLPGSVSFFENQRRTTSQLYRSEWFFIQNILREGLSVLDIGCALGGFADICSEQLSNFSYTGLDISKNMVDSAKKKHPQHTFYHISEADLSSVFGKKYDLVLCLGILHLSFKWRELIVEAWKLTKGSFVFDLRETANNTIEDIRKSYFKMDFNNTDELHKSTKLPYNIINSGESLSFLTTQLQNYVKFSHFGYYSPVSSSAVTTEKEVLMNVYCAERV